MSGVTDVVPVLSKNVQQTWLAPNTATTTGGATQFDFGTAVPANLQSLVQPDYPRNVVITLSGTESALSVTVSGIDARGRTVDETLVLTVANTGPIGSVPFAVVTVCLYIFNSFSKPILLTVKKV